MLLLSADFFFKIDCFKKFIQEHQHIKGFDPDQDGHSVCADLGPNCLQRLPEDDKDCC